MMTQEQIMDFLTRPDSYAHAVDDVTRIETHSSQIFLAGAFAYKLKREVKYPFLDFSSLAKRRHAARNELEVNRRYTPELYLQLVAVCANTEGRLFLDERTPPAHPQQVVEWLVKMRRFKQEDLYMSRAAKGYIDQREAAQLAGMVRTSHAASPIVIEPQQARRNLLQLLRETTEFFDTRPHLLHPDLQDTLCARLEEECARHCGVIEQRARDGFVRHCHGDLHLGNIVHLEGRPKAFDAIEFNDQIATIDILFDAAFLLMDLWRVNLRAQASQVFNQLLSFEDIKGLQGLELLPLFMSLRALIRLRAARLRLESRGAHFIGAADQVAIDNYGALARACLETPRPVLIGIGGLSGSGKSTIARTLAPDLFSAPGAVVLRSDVERKLLFDMAETERLPQSAYARDVTQQVYARLQQKAGAVVEAGRSVIVDAVHAHPLERQALEQIARDKSAPFHGFWLQAPADKLRARVAARTNDASDATPGIVTRQLDYELGEMSWQEIDTSGGIKETSRKALTHLT